MKILLVLAAALAVASAQFPGFVPPQDGRYYTTPRPLLPVPPPVRPILPSPPPRPDIVAVNRVATIDAAANIVRYDNDIFPDGSYNYAFETDNGIAAQAQGTPRALGGNPPVEPVVSQGSFSWTSPEGVPIVISYIADENGYQPQGDSIPTPPPIPAAIARSLEYIARNPPAAQPQIPIRQK